MQFIILFSRHPEKTAIPAPGDLREAEYQSVRGFYSQGFIRQIRLRGDAGEACVLVECNPMKLQKLCAVTGKSAR
jgi:hypothetical protein